MYNLVTAVLMAKDKPTGLSEVDVSKTSIGSLLGNYQMGYLVLTNTHLSGEMFLTLETMRSTNLNISDYTNTTVTAWLIQNGDKLLPHINDEPLYEFTKLNYCDAHQSGFEKKAVHPTSTIEDFPVSSMTDLYIHKDSVDGNILCDNSVAVINGYLHTHSRYKQGIKVSDGCRTQMFSKRGQCGIISFNDCGGVKLVNLNMDMIHRTADLVSYYQEVLIELGRPLVGKGLLLSVAGQLIYSKDVYKVIDPENGVVVLNLARLNFIDRIQQALEVLEMPELLTLGSGNNIKQISTEVVLSDPFILAVLRMSQTFFMITDQPTMAVERTPVSYQGVYGRYFSADFQYDIMVDDYGRIVPYFYYGNQSYPFLVDKHVYAIPKEFTEKTQNIRNRNAWRYTGVSFNETITEHTQAMPIDWLNIKFIKPA